MQLLTTAISLLKDTLTYLKQIDRNAFQEPLELLSQASIGQHSRHFIEFYQCLLWQCQEPNAMVNYDKRRRDQRIEQEPEMASQAIGAIIDYLEKVDAPARLRLQTSFMDEAEISIESTFERELLYNIEHTIHHLAIIKIGLKLVAPHIELPSHFGVAASTIKYRNALCAQ